MKQIEKTLQMIVPKIKHTLKKRISNYTLMSMVVISILFINYPVHASENTVTEASSENIPQEHDRFSPPNRPNLNDQAEPNEHDGMLGTSDSQISMFDNLYQKIDFVRHRFANLIKFGAPIPPKKQGITTEDPAWKNDLAHTPLLLLSLLGAILLTAFTIELVFRSYTRRFFPQPPPDQRMTWYKKATALCIRTCFELAGLLFFLLSVIFILLLLPNEIRPHQIVISTCLNAIALVKTVSILSRTFLAPKAENLRILPIKTETARYLYNRVLFITNIGALGWLISNFIELFSIFKSASFLSFVITSTLVCLVLIIMCIEKRTAVKNVLQKTLPKTKVMQEVAGVWHHLAIIYILIIWAACFLGLLLVGPKTVFSATVTILAIPLFFLMDWLMQALVDWWLHFSKNENEVFDSGNEPLVDDLPEPTRSVQGLNNMAQLYSEGFTFGLRFIIRVVLAALIFFNLLSMWGLDLEIGKIVTATAMNIIIATLICVIIWKIANRIIMRKLKEELPNQDEDIEEGGAGGSRKGTLLLLFQKFLLSLLFVVALFAVLTSLGINVGPLIAGAGVIGLAIGFGAQTLVQDIISGIFFLMDDAFRVGDFVDTGSSQGTVEHISLRSLRIRHPRGMVHTIPFGDIPSVTNFSRDYIITKLDIRVPFDTDIDKVRKIVKKIYNEILNDEELGPKLLGKMKSQGVRELDDSALIIRIKFKSIPGEQFILRREVFRRLQEAFQSNGLEFASRKVMVEMPKIESPQPSDSDVRQAAAAALTTNKPT